MFIWEKLQKKVVNLICGTGSYIQQIRMLIRQLSNEPQSSIELLHTQDLSSRSNELLKLPKTWTEKMQKDFVFLTSRLANKVNHLMDLSSSTGLKKRIIQLLWKFVEIQLLWKFVQFNENNTRTLPENRMQVQNRTVFSHDVLFS